MKKPSALLALALALACGGESFNGVALDTPREDVGTLQQPIYMPSGYGSEEGDQTRCDSDWSGGLCVVPDNRSPNFGIDQCGTNDSLFHRNIYTALGYVIGVTNSVPLEWATTRSHSSGGDYVIRCVGDTSGTPMSTSYNSITADCHDTERGQLCQSKSGTITVRTGVILNTPGFQAATASQRDRIINNMIRHEAGHVIGFGHVPSGPGKLMSVGFTPTPVPGVDAWDNLYTFDSTEIHALDCYRETSGTTPRC
jgi:hypothetical protein